MCIRLSDLLIWPRTWRKSLTRFDLPPDRFFSRSARRVSRFPSRQKWEENTSYTIHGYSRSVYWILRAACLVRCRWCTVLHTDRLINRWNIADLALKLENNVLFHWLRIGPEYHLIRIMANIILSSLCPALAEHTVFVVSVRNGSQLSGVPRDLRLAGHTSATHTFLVSCLHYGDVGLLWRHSWCSIITSWWRHIIMTS